MKKTCSQRETLSIAGFALDGSKWDGLSVGRRKGGDSSEGQKLTVLKSAFGGKLPPAIPVVD